MYSFFFGRHDSIIRNRANYDDLIILVGGPRVLLYFLLFGFISIVMTYSVLVSVWHYECHLAEEAACSLLQYYLELMTKHSMRVNILSRNIDELRLVLRFYLLSL